MCFGVWENLWREPIWKNQQPGWESCVLVSWGRQGMKEILTLPPKSMETQLGRETRISLERRPRAEVRDKALGAEKWVGHRM